MPSILDFCETILPFLKIASVDLDWFVDLFFPRDIIRLSSVLDEKSVLIAD